MNTLVNNAGILRDRMVFSMSDAEWDDVVRVHLRGHFMPTKVAALHWRELAKAGKAVKASVVNTTSTSGLLSNPGQSNYGAAKSGIATFTEICQKELGRYGVRCNAIAPAARTRLTATVPGSEERYATRAQAEGGRLRVRQERPENISPIVAYLSTEDCPIKGKVFFVWANEVRLLLMIQPSPVRVAVLRMPDGSDPASGSVSANEATTRPSAIASSHRFFCASVP